MSLQNKPSIAPFTTLKLWVEPIALLILAPFLLFPGRFAKLDWHPYWIILLGLSIMLPWLVDSRRRQITPLSGCISLILLWLPVNYWASIDRAASWQVLGYLLLGVASYRAFIQSPFCDKSLQYLIYLLLLIGIALTLIGPFFLLADPSYTAVTPLLQFPLLSQLAATLTETINANVLAGALLILLPLYTALIGPNRFLTWPTLRLILLLLWLLMIGLLVVTQSRGALLAAIIAIILVITLAYTGIRWFILVMILLLIGGAIWFDLQSLFVLVTSSSVIGGLDGRIEIWSRALYAFHDFPFTGIGIGTFHKLIPLLYPYFLWTPDQEISHAHNLFIQIGVDLGLFGLIGHIALWLNLFGMIIVLLRRQDPSVRILAAGVCGSLIAMLLHGLVDAVTWGNKLAFLPWWLYALITLLFLKERQTSL